MNKFLIALFITVFSSTAFAQMYVSGGVHGMFVEQGSETDFIKGVQASLGYRISPHLLAEVGLGGTKANNTNVETQYARFSLMPAIDITEKTTLFVRGTYMLSTSDDWDNDFEKLTDPISANGEAASRLGGEGDYQDGFSVSVGAFHYLTDTLFVRFGVGTKINEHVDNVWTSVGIGREF